MVNKYDDVEEKEPIRPRGKGKGRNETNLGSRLNFKLFKPIILFETIGTIVGLIVLIYLFYLSGALLVKEEIFKSILGIVILSIMIFMTAVKGKSVIDIIEEETSIFVKQFSYKEKGKKIATLDQLNFLMSIVENAFRNWKISWLVYTAIVITVYIVGFYFGLYSAAILSIIILLSAMYVVPAALGNLQVYFSKKTKTIPASPPSIGVMTLFGNPFDFDLILDAGTAIIYPGVIDLIVIEVHQEPQDFEDMKGFITKDNIPVELKKTQLLYVPDIKRIGQFISAKMQTGVYDTLDSMISNRLKDIIRSLSFADLLSKKGKLEDEVKLELTGKDEEDDELRDMRRNGVSDDHLLGITIFRFNIGMIDTTDEYKKEMLKRATEERQQEAEIIEVGTEIKQATLLFEAYKDVKEPKSFSECLAMVRDDKIAREGKFIIPGLRNALGQNAFGALLKALIGGKGNV